MKFKKTDPDNILKILKDFSSYEEFLLWTGNKFSYPIKEEEFLSYLDNVSNLQSLSFFVNNELIGYGEITRIKEDSASISRLLILNNFRSKGYGKVLIKTIIDYAFDEFNLKELTLNVIESNEKAIKLYEYYGFEKIKNSHYKINNDLKGFMMTKIL